MLPLKDKLWPSWCLRGREDIRYVVTVTGQNTIASIKQDVVFTDIKGRIANI